MEFGGRTRTAATAGPRRPSDGKIGGLRSTVRPKSLSLAGRSR